MASKNDDSAPFRCIALVVDNLDQTPPAVQIRAITEVEQWMLNPQIRLWRVFLPLWPSTYAYLTNHRFNMLRGVKVFRIGAVNSGALIANHERAIENDLLGSSSAHDQQAAAFFTDTMQFAWPRLLPRLEGLSHGSLRLLMSLWGGSCGARRPARPAATTTSCSTP